MGYRHGVTARLFAVQARSWNSRVTVGFHSPGFNPAAHRAAGGAQQRSETIGSGLAADHLDVFLFAQAKPAGFAVIPALFPIPGNVLIGSAKARGRRAKSVPDAEPLSAVLRRESESGPCTVTFDASGVTRFDSALPAFVLRCREIAVEHGAPVDTATLPEGVRRLFALALARTTGERTT